jgi:hypothetical protein
LPSIWLTLKEEFLAPADNFVFTVGQGDDASYVYPMAVYSVLGSHEIQIEESVKFEVTFLESSSTVWR